MLSRANYEDYLIRLYFGDGPFLDQCIRRAYLDFNRTLHGIRNLDCKSALDDEARDKLRSLMTELRDDAAIGDQQSFDAWHRRAYSALADVYEANGCKLSVGQAQKWINMTLKYIFTMGEQRLPGYSRLYDFCHVPIDRIILGRLEEHGFDGLPCSAWSRLDDYHAYMECQEWIRTTFKEAPLDVECRFWMGD